MSAFKLYENKQFNNYKKKMPHLTHLEISDLIYYQWKFGISEADKDEYFKKFRETQLKYLEETE